MEDNFEIYIINSLADKHYESGAERTSNLGEKVAEKLISFSKDSVQKACEAIGFIALKLTSEVGSALKEKQTEEISIEFSVSVGAKGSIYIVESDSNANIKISIKLKQ